MDRVNVSILVGVKGAELVLKVEPSACVHVMVVEFAYIVMYAESFPAYS